MADAADLKSAGGKPRWTHESRTTAAKYTSPKNLQAQTLN